jgi:hypothetical protein
VGLGKVNTVRPGGDHATTIPLENPGTSRTTIYDKHSVEVSKVIEAL